MTLKQLSRSLTYMASALAAFCIMSCSDDNGGNEEKEETTVTDTKGTLSLETASLPYHEVTFSNDGNSEKPCIVVFLHGGTCAGNDNEAQMTEAGVDSISKFLKTSNKNAILLVPQCDKESSWVNMRPAVGELISKFLPRADAGQVYILGGSMGGTGTWGMLKMFPTLFAAAMPVAGDPTKSPEEYTSTTPVITVLGGNDKVIKPQGTVNLIDELKDKGVDVWEEIVTAWSHEETCIQSYSMDRLGWLFKHTKNTTGE